VKTLTAALVAVGCLALAGALEAQDSQFGIPGLGTPGRWESVRSRTAGGAFAAFDPTSSLTEASLADIRSLTASAEAGASYRQVEGPGSSTWLRSTRYPQFTVGGPVGKRLFIGGGFATYLDKTYDVVTRGDTMLRGVDEPYTDAIASDGGVTDLRLAAATRFGPHLALGVGLHLLPGSTRVTADRHFDDTTTYHDVLQAGTVRYDGLGFSASAIITMTPQLAVAAFARTDGRLNAYVGDTVVARSDLPATIGGAVRWTPTPAAKIGGSVMWRSWSRTGPNAFDTVNWAAGLELGTGAPLRIGVRGGQLPFGAAPGASAPTEWGVAIGTGRVISHGRGLFDIGLERLARDSGSLHERVWTILVGLTIRP